MERERNQWLDVSKLIASVFVICVHIRFYGDLGRAVNASARFAVPLFFSVSGFFVLNADSKTVKRRIVKVLVLYLIAAAVYHTAAVITALYSGGVAALRDYFCATFLDIGKILKLLFLNEDLAAPHLWFLPALIYVYLIWLAVIRYSVSDRIIFYVSIFALAVHLTLGELLSTQGIILSNYIVRNFALMGFPFFALGYLMAKNKQRLIGIRTYVLIILILFGTAESVLSILLFSENDLYLGSVFCWFSVMVLSLKNSKVRFNPAILKCTAASADIYVYHVLLSNIFTYVLAAAGLDVTGRIFVNVWPLILFPLCIGFSLIKGIVLSSLKRRPPSHITPTSDS